MTTEEVLSGNRLICDFMGVKPKSYIPEVFYWQDAPFFYVSEHGMEKVMDAIVGYVKYHKSWDWLMPVVEKIIKTIGVKTYQECTYEEWAISTHLTRMTIGMPIESVYYAVIDYIKYYNSLTK
jgi:hypothetical protein